MSFVTISLTKELKTSKFRQGWIDGLRDDLSKFFGASSAFARASQHLQIYGAEHNSAPLSFAPAHVGEFRYQAAETFLRVKLRLNPKEADHIELLRLMQSAIDQQNEVLAGAKLDERVLVAIEAANDYAPQVLKREWERVKGREKSFRIARLLFGVIAAVILVTFLILLWSGRFGIQLRHHTAGR